MSYLCLFADPNIGRSPSPIYHVVQNACWREYETANVLLVLLASAICKLLNVFVQITQCICINCKVYLFKLKSVFLQIAKCICSPIRIMHARENMKQPTRKQLVLLHSYTVLLASADCGLRQLPLAGAPSTTSSPSQDQTLTQLCKDLSNQANHSSEKEDKKKRKGRKATQRPYRHHEQHPKLD